MHCMDADWPTSESTAKSVLSPIVPSFVFSLASRPWTLVWVDFRQKGTTLEYYRIAGYVILQFTTLPLVWRWDRIPQSPCPSFLVCPLSMYGKRKPQLLTFGAIPKLRTQSPWEYELRWGPEHGHAYSSQYLKQNACAGQLPSTHTEEMVGFPVASPRLRDSGHLPS